MTERYAAVESINGKLTTLVVNLNEEGMLSRPTKHPYIHDILAQRLRTMLEELREFSQTTWEAYEKAVENGEEVEEPTLPKNIEQLRVSGYMYGGKYPGLPTAPGCTHAGSDDGPFYAQDISFCVMNVGLNDTTLPFMDGITLAYSFNLPVVPIGIFGTLEEVIEWTMESSSNNTLIPTQQPLLDEAGNPVVDAEGQYKTLPSLYNNTVCGWEVVKAY